MDEDDDYTVCRGSGEPRSLLGAEPNEEYMAAARRQVEQSSWHEAQLRKYLEETTILDRVLKDPPSSGRLTKEDLEEYTALLKEQRYPVQRVVPMSREDYEAIVKGMSPATESKPFEEQTRPPSRATFDPLYLGPRPKPTRGNSEEDPSTRVLTGKPTPTAPQDNMSVYIINTRTTSSQGEHRIVLLIEDEYSRQREISRTFRLLPGESEVALAARRDDFLKSIQAGPWGAGGPTYCETFADLEKKIDDFCARQRKEAQALYEARDVSIEPAPAATPETPTTQAAKPATTQDSRMSESKMRNVGGEMLDAAKTAAGITAANKVRRAATEGVLAALVRAGALTEEQAQNELLQMVAGAVVPTLVMIGAEYGENIIPNSEAVKVGAKYAAVGANAELMDALIPELLPMLQMFGVLAVQHFADEVESSGGTKQLSGDPSPSVSDVLSSAKERERVPSV